MLNLKKLLTKILQQLSAIGTIKTDYLRSNTSVPNNTYTALCTISLDKGVWVINGGARWATNVNGSRDTNISTTSGSTAMQLTTHPNQNNWTQTNLTQIVNVSADGTPYYLNARQTSGGALNALTANAANSGTYITAVRIA